MARYIVSTAVTADNQFGALLAMARLFASDDPTALLEMAQTGEIVVRQARSKGEDAPEPAGNTHIVEGTGTPERTSGGSVAGAKSDWNMGAK